MGFKRLEDFERHRREQQQAEREKRARLDLRKAVKDALPAGVKAALPKRSKGRVAIGGVSKHEVKALREQAVRYLDGEGGLRQLEAEVQRQAVVILLIDGVLGTEPWRASAGPHGGLIAANARLRYLENAARLLDDLRRSRGMQTASDKLLEGVIDAEKT